MRIKNYTVSVKHWRHRNAYDEFLPFSLSDIAEKISGIMLTDCGVKQYAFGLFIRGRMYLGLEIGAHPENFGLGLVIDNRTIGIFAYTD